MSIYQRLEHLNNNLIKKRDELTENLIKSPQTDYVGYRHIQGRILQLNEILANIKEILTQG